jgi:5'-methylthioadenosine phosphorylase
MHDYLTIAVIGGSGLYKIAGLEDIHTVEAVTPFGRPSSPIVIGTLANTRIAFLARHGTGHQIMPPEVNYRSNIYALKNLGVERIISISACGSLRDDFAPGDIVVPDQLFDFTRDRRRTFFGEGLVAHISVADPFCNELSTSLIEALTATQATVHRGGSFITIEGPRFSTRLESNTYRSWGMSIIGMTTSPEAFLAREAEMCYAVMAHVTDYDVWHISEDPVSVEMVIDILNKNTVLAQEGLKNLLNILPDSRSCNCDKALAGALITAPEGVPPETIDKLDLLVGKYLKKRSE